MMLTRNGRFVSMFCSPNIRINLFLYFLNFLLSDSEKVYSSWGLIRSPKNWIQGILRYSKKQKQNWVVKVQLWPYRCRSCTVRGLLPVYWFYSFFNCSAAEVPPGGGQADPLLERQAHLDGEDGAGAGQGAPHLRHSHVHSSHHLPILQEAAQGSVSPGHAVQR